MSPLPLDGLTAVSLAVNVPGPVAAARLRALGARVVKVEPPSGDPLEAYALMWYLSLAEGQEVVRMDLKDAAQRVKLDTLLADADVLLTSSRPAALERLGLGPLALRERFPRLCQVSIVGYPGDRRDHAGHDLTYQATLGLIDPWRLPRTLVADLAGAEQAVSAALSLLLARERGRGSGHVEVALSDAADSFAAPFRHGLTAPRGLLGGGNPAYRIYQARRGSVALAALEPHFLERLRAELELPVVLEAGLERAFRTRTAEEWEAWATERDIPLVAVRGA